MELKLGIITDLLLPKYSRYSGRAGSYLSIPSNLELQKISLESPQSDYLDSLGYFLAYKDTYKQLLKQAKYDGEFAVIKDIARQLSKSLQLSYPDIDLITYAPKDPLRNNKRGFHLPEIIAQEFARSLSVKMTELVAKTQSTEAQMELSRVQRLTNLDNVFRLKQQHVNLANFNKILIIDDVVTTGSTIYNTARTIKNEYPFLKLHGLALMH